LKNETDYVGIGSFIQDKKGSFFLPQDSNVIESELYKGKLPIVKESFLFKNIPEALDDDFFKLVCKL